MLVKILRRGTLLAFNDATMLVDIFRDSTVIIHDDTIAAILSEDEFGKLDVPVDADVTDCQGRIISPGFINTHVHMWMSAYRTLGSDITLAQYFGGWLMQDSKDAMAFTPNDIYISCLQGYVEGIHAGVTSYVDHAHNNWASNVAEPGFIAAQDAGARVWWCYDVSDNEAFPLQDQWAALRRVASKTTAPSLVQPGISLDMQSMNFAKPGSNSLEHTQRMIEELNLKVITLHHLGGPWPNDGHSSPVQICQYKMHNSERSIIFSHAPFLTPEEQRVLQDHDLFVSITPESECHFGHGQVTGRLISKQAALGLDTNWTFSGDMLSQARLWLQTVRQANFNDTLQRGLLPNKTPFTAEQAFLMVTRQGGLALRRRDLGVLQVGAKADLAVFNGEAPNMLGWKDPIAAVMLHANPSDVEHVLIGGEFRKRDFQLANSKMAPTELRDRFLETANRIQSIASHPPQMPEKVWGVGQMGDVETASTV